MAIAGIMRVWRLGLWFVVAGVLAGCIYTNTTQPFSWVSNTRLDVQDLTLEEREITGQSTAYAIWLLFSGGDSGL
ncbi:MAG: hypothetical protein L0Y56_13490, partial [Nitrospira sp.]|nr:hypothetical protein [Nitrospira sp.]